ncbi:hypothetical protein F4804DRAFT_277028 [Jackrogersella minutella]|nr:hypothetical protein F4804DRAFT_277028 [Jackrogersella minutella]
MACCYTDRDQRYNSEATRDLAYRISRESRYPTHYIMNEGRVVLDRKILKHNNAIIYNAPGSSLRVTPSNRTLASRFKYTSYYAPESSDTCRDCWREEYYRGYCHECASLRYISAPSDESYRLHDREYRFSLRSRSPERKYISYC